MRPVNQPPLSLIAMKRSPLASSRRPDNPPKPRNREVRISPLRYSRELEYRSGLVLTSPFRGFGGFSGLRLDAKGERFIAISDKGSWFTGRIVYKGREMTGLDDVEASPMLGPDGRPITSRGWFETEALALDGSLVYVGIERVNQVLRFDFAKGFTRAHRRNCSAAAGGAQAALQQGARSAGGRAEGLPLAGTLIAMSERGLDAQRQYARLSDRRPIARAVRDPPHRQFRHQRCGAAAVGRAAGAGTQILLVGGVGIRIRRVALAAIAPGAVIDGPSIFEADLGNEIDNMEGIDAHVTPEGETVLTLVSDDNFSMIQRNLLLQFTLVA